jgi:hypothetical protein
VTKIWHSQALNRVLERPEQKQQESKSAWRQRESTEKGWATKDRSGLNPQAEIRELRA